MSASLALGEVPGLLGLEQLSDLARSPLKLVSRIQKGLPVSALTGLAETLAPGDASFKYRVVPKATLARRIRDGRLSADEGARLARLAALWSDTLELWKDEEDARDFLFRKHMMLDDRRPIDVAIESEIGAGLVHEILGGLRYGTAV